MIRTAASELLNEWYVFWLLYNLYDCAQAWDMDVIFDMGTMLTVGSIKRLRYY